MAERGVRTSGYRGYVDYEKVKQDNRERATSFHWELTFTRKPSGVYLPPDTIMKIRFDEMTELPKINQGALLETELHGWKYFQYGQNDYSGGFGMKGIDFIDQSLEYAFREITYESDRPLDHTAKPKDELLWDAELIEFNNQDFPIHKWSMRDCLMETFDPQRQLNHGKDLNGEVTVTWKASMITEAQLNIAGLQ